MAACDLRDKCCGALGHRSEIERRIEKLEEENARLRAENERLRRLCDERERD